MMTHYDSIAKRILEKNEEKFQKFDSRTFGSYGVQHFFHVILFSIKFYTRICKKKN